MPQTAKRLIEVALPIQEISAESVRDKSIRHGHISTLHLWWARRPLPVCRAVVFATLIPDPEDADCPHEFRKAVEILLSKEAATDDFRLAIDKHEGNDPYNPYDDIPWTAIFDPMPDTLRNRLQMFIGKFSKKHQDFLLGKTKKAADPKEQLSAFSLIKWESRRSEPILNIARQLLWVSYNLEETQEHKTKSAEDLLAEYATHWKRIQDAEQELYSLPDRHIPSPDVMAKEQALELAKEAFLSRMPKVFDPFAGGGAIPLEAARLGCRSYGNDLNPVAHIIQKGSLEFPQKFGKPITYTKEAFLARYGEEAWKALPQDWIRLQGGSESSVQIPNRLSFDVEYYAKTLLLRAEAKIGKFYPTGPNGNKPIAYYWARVATCSNPSCGAEVPLLRGFALCDKPNKKVFLRPNVEGNQIDFQIVHEPIESEGWMVRANLSCPICGNITPNKELKKLFKQKSTSERLLAVIEDSNEGKIYRLPTAEEVEILKNIPVCEKPNELLPQNDSQNLKIPLWGFPGFGDMFSPRQLLALQTFVEELKRLQNLAGQTPSAANKPKAGDLVAQLFPHEFEYDKAVLTYLGILVDRVAVVNTSFGVWHTSGEKLERIMGRQAIPMVFDFPESNPFCDSTGSAHNQVEWLTRYIESESDVFVSASCQNSASGDHLQFSNKELTAVITDPPYYDAIAYADLSDFFYVWLKRTLGSVYPQVLSTPQTPKSEECTALKHHHNGNADQAKLHFTNTLTNIFKVLEEQTSGLLSIMFAHQSNEAWSTLCHSILEAKRNITGSWSVDSEMTGALKTDKGFLASSVTVSCRSAERAGVGSFPEVKRAIDKRVKDEVEKLFSLGFRGADLLTGSFGQAVSEFGQFVRVEKPNGDPVDVKELLDYARDCAFKALVGGGGEDQVTRFVLAWLNLFGYSKASHDEVNRIVQVGLNVDLQELVHRQILTRDGNEESLTPGLVRASRIARLGEGDRDPRIDQIQKAMFLFQGNRSRLVTYLARVAPSPEHPFWKSLAAVSEVLPEGEEKKLSREFLASKESLLQEIGDLGKGKAVQQDLGL